MKHIVKISSSVGLGVFLITGLSGCETKSCTKGSATYTDPKKVQECLQSGGVAYYPSYLSSNKSSGYFSNTSSPYSSNLGG